MSFQSDIRPLTPKERADFGFARVRDVAFDAIQTLWQRRKTEGMKQTDIVKAIGAHPTWVSKKLKAPGNWTLRTLGELAVALDGEIEIVVHAFEDKPTEPSNYHAYANYGTEMMSPKAMSQGTQIIGELGAAGSQHAEGH